MKAAAFEYLRAKDVADAVKALASMPGDAKPLAGGQSLGPMLNLRLARPKLLVDLGRIERLKEIRDEGDAWLIGAGVTHAELEDRPLPDCAPLAAVARTIAYRAIRTRGTIGGSLAHADPAADWPLALSALDAKLILSGKNGRREVPAGEFMKSAFATALGDDEILEAVRVPKLGARAAWGYYKFCRKTGEFPEASAALLLDPERRLARLYAGALHGAPTALDAVARAVAQGGAQAASSDLVDAALERVIPGMGAGARKMRAAAVRRAIERAFS
jgi:aerobic carbon-monoxide dehydrogenase medium subunit